jgi:hypothetical protein
MHGLLDEILVGGALLASIIYALFSLGPRTLRRGLAVRAAAAIKPKGGCGGCDDCGSATPAPESTGSADPEIRIPVSTIGKR